MPIIKFKKLTEDAVTPTRAYGYGNCWDIYASRNAAIHSYCSTMVHTDLAFEIPVGYQLHIYNRSSNPIKNNLILSNSTGILDQDYRGELCCLFHSLPDKKPATGLTMSIWDELYDRPVNINKGDKIAQIKLVPILEEDLQEVEELSETTRGEGGFGSSGK